MHLSQAFKCFKYTNNFLNFYLLLLPLLLLLIHWLLTSFQVLYPLGSCWSIFFFFSNEHISQVSVNARTMPLSIIFVVLVSSYCLHQWVVTHISICILHSYWYPPLCPLCTCSYVCLKKWLVCTFCAFVALLYNVPHFTMVLWA